MIRLVFDVEVETVLKDYHTVFRRDLRDLCCFYAYGDLSRRLDGRSFSVLSQMRLDKGTLIRWFYFGTANDFYVGGFISQSAPTDYKRLSRVG